MVGRDWFCPFDNTYFTAEQVKDGRCPRCGGSTANIDQERAEMEAEYDHLNGSEGH